VPFNASPENVIGDATIAGADSDASQTPSPPAQSAADGIFISEGELMALKQWAASREEELGRLCTAREEEVRQLRTQLAVSEAALREALGEVPDHERLASEQPSRRQRLSNREANALALALSSRRRAKAAATRKSESAVLRSEWRSARAAMAAVDATQHRANGPRSVHNSGDE